MKTTAELIAAFEAKRAAHVAKASEIMNTAAEEGSTLTAEQGEEYEALQTEITAIDVHLARLQTQQALEKAKATTIDPVTGQTAAAASAARGGSSVITVKRDLPKGCAFGRYVQAVALSKGNLPQALVFAERWNDSTPEVTEVLKAAVAAGTTTDPAWAKPLVAYTTMASEFIELLRPATIIGNISGFRRVPFNVRIAGTLTGTTAGWVGEGASKPVSAMSFGETLLGWAKAAGIVVITQELARFSDPSAEAVVRNDLRDTIAAFLDSQFINPAVAAVANVHPASITNGVTAIPSSGGTLANVTADLQTVFANLAAANISPLSGHWITTPAVAIGLSMMLNPLGQQAFPNTTMTGGTLLGFPVVVSNSVPAGLLVFAVANEIFLADDGDVTIDASQEASLQMDSAPATPPLSTALVSLWQQNLIGVKAERYINWAKRRAAAVQVITGSAPTPPSLLELQAAGGGSTKAAPAAKA